MTELTFDIRAGTRLDLEKSVRPGSEKIHVKGGPRLKREEDYRIDYQSGRIWFYGSESVRFLQGTITLVWDP